MECVHNLDTQEIPPTLMISAVDILQQLKKIINTKDVYVYVWLPELLQGPVVCGAVLGVLDLDSHNGAWDRSVLIVFLVLILLILQ